MKTTKLTSILLALCFFFTPIVIYPWGFLGHKTINEIAVYTLPDSMFGFYKMHLNYIVSSAVNADKRRYVVENEAPRHFLDADHYENEVPLDTLPHTWKDAVAKYGQDSLLKYGIVPWHVILVKYQLTEAFKAHDYKAILRLSADLGHYVGDLHVPLHATGNYNGQKTNQHGIHGLWESRLPELFQSDYNYFVGKARYVDNVTHEVWMRFEQSYAAVDSVLSFELQATEHTSETKKYTFEDRGRQVVQTYSTHFCEEYHNMLNGMVEARLRASIEFVGSLWFTAWVDAGQPHLRLDWRIGDDLERIGLDSAYQHQKIKGRMEAK
ncbi:MAG: hypothetical protein ACI8ZN_000411 [Bacteroidia bacterium]|jgi:hypothetical protein